MRSKKVSKHIASMALKAIGRGVLESVDRAIVERALTVAGGNRSEAARLLGVDRKVIERRIARYGLGRAGKGRR